MTGEIIIDQGSVTDTIKRLSRLPATVGRRALRRGISRVGTATVKQLRRAAPRGRTGQFARSLAKKDVRYAQTGTYLALAGQNRKRRSTAKQIARSIRKTGLISRGLSGRGLQPALHWIEAGTKQHRIAPKARKNLYWNIVKGDIRVPIQTAPRVVHPGHDAQPFVEVTERRYRRERISIVHREVQEAVIREARKGGS